VLQILPKLETGGAERSTIDVAEALAAAGYAALVISEGGRMVGELAAAGGEHIEMMAASKSPLTILANARRIAKIIDERNVKLVHARSRAPAWSALLAARKMGVPFVTTYHGLYSARGAFKRWYNSVMVRGAAVIATSEGAATFIAAQHPSHRARIIVIPRGIDTRVFDPGGVPPERVSALRQTWGAAEGEIVALLPGRLTRMKGQLVLIEAMAQMQATGTLDGLRAVLAGDAQGRDAYEAEVARAIDAAGLQGRVVVAGHVSDMAAAYLASDIALAPSIYAESFGRVPVEAGAMGTPAIATGHGGARETVRDGITGLLIPPGDAKALAEALARLLAIGEKGRCAMGAESRAHVLARYTKDAMCAATISLYRELIG
jgi:glycosyltransferase involved in cell wall biosynthesis